MADAPRPRAEYLNIYATIPAPQESTAELLAAMDAKRKILAELEVLTIAELF